MLSAASTASRAAIEAKEAEKAAKEAAGEPEEAPKEDIFDEEFEFEPPPELPSMKPGQEYFGRVTKVLDFGAFVDIGESREGLVPRSKLQDGWVDNVEDVVKVGQNVQVWVSEFNNDKLTLSMSKNKIFSSQGRSVDLAPFEGMDSSTFLPGTVASIQPFGAFVSVTAPGAEAPAQGLVHITQIKDAFVESVDEELTIGQEVEVRVISVDQSAKKLGLSMKKEPGPNAAKPGQQDVAAFEAVSDTDWLPGTVKSLVNFGAFVEVTPPNGPAAQGLLHISQIQEGFIEDPAEALEVDQEVQVRVMDVNFDTGKFALSMRAPATASS